MKALDDTSDEWKSDSGNLKESDAQKAGAYISQILLDARKRCGISQNELARRSGITQGNISRLEKGLANPSMKVLMRLADGMDMRLTIGFEEI